jgi:hypothetical protein
VTAYCSPSDLYAFGIARGAVPNPGRVVDSANATANTITLDVHGFVLNDPVSFRAEAGGTLPAPLVAGSTYYAIPVTESAFSVATAEDGAAVDLSSAGENFVVIAPLPIDASIAWASRLIDDMLPAHVVPIEEPIPEIVRMTAAELAAHKLLSTTGAVSTSLTMVADHARKRLERWAAGIPIRGTNAPTPTNLAAAAAVPYVDSRGWNRYGGIS